MAELPPIGLGTGQLTGPDAISAVSTALNEGYRLIDTGAIYGNEVEVGLAVNQSTVDRNDIVVITKGAHDSHEHGYQTVLEQFEASLGRLALTYVDYYLVHWPSNPERRLDTWRAMEEIYESGRARAIGVSNYSSKHLAELQDAAMQPAVNQIEFHPYIFAEQRDILEYCTSHDIRVVGYSTFANGQADTDKTVGAIATVHGVTPRQVLTRWSMQHGVVPLVRSRSGAHIAQNIQVANFELSDHDMAQLNNLHGAREFPDPHLLP